MDYNDLAVTGTVTYQAREIRRQAQRIAYICQTLEKLDQSPDHTQRLLSEIASCSQVIQARLRNVRD